jgi:hypothetical protein
MILGHIHIGTVGMEGAFETMASGEVDGIPEAGGQI